MRSRERSKTNDRDERCNIPIICMDERKGHYRNLLAEKKNECKRYIIPNQKHKGYQYRPGFTFTQGKKAMELKRFLWNWLNMDPLFCGYSKKMFNTLRKRCITGI